MKCAAVFALLLSVAFGPLPADAGRLVLRKETPAAKVVGLLEELKRSIEADGQKEQEAYDKYACWCEETLGRKANDISTGKETIESSEASMKELNAQIGSHAAEIKNLKAAIAANVESQREANEVRQKDFLEYTEDKTESEQCIGALEAAIKVLTGAGTGKFLETLQEAKLLSVLAGVRGMLKSKAAVRLTSSGDLQAVQHFVEKPEDFLGERAGVMSAVQIANNPFGDYAPQSTQIQGVLKGMYDTFTADLEKANVEEADQQKAHEQLMATKQAELDTLQKTLEKQNLEKADKTKQLADTTMVRDTTAEELKADEAFFAETKAACKDKAAEWSERTRLRTEELRGIAQAVMILHSPEAQKTFENATGNFLQLSAENSHRSRSAAYEKLKALAGRFHSLSLAKLAVQVRASGHFDKVIQSIDSMIALLRKEEQADIAHRDRCQRADTKNTNDMEDLNGEITKTNATINRMTEDANDLKLHISALEQKIVTTKEEMATQLGLRNDARADFEQELKFDADAVVLLERAIVVLSSFYKRNKIPLGLVAHKRHKESPEYFMDPNKAPRTWEGGRKYGGRKGESTGILAILEMIKEDLQKEIETSRREEATAQQQYETARSAAQAVLDKQVASKTAAEAELAALEGRKLDTENHKTQKEGDLQAESELKDAIYADCAWVDTHFTSRRDKRKTEMDGLVQAKDYLAGVEEEADQ